MNLHKALLLSAAVSLAALATSDALAQGRQAEFWWLQKSPGGVYKPPMRPLWKLADLKKMHAGQHNWSEQIIKDPEQDVTYNSGAPGFAITPRMHPDTYSAFVIISGQVAFNVEGQQPVTGVRGSIIAIPKTTVFSAEVKGDTDALWVEINPINYKTIYPASEPKPAALPGFEVVKVQFPHKPGKLHPPTQFYWNLWDAIASCAPRGPTVVEEHIYINPLINYANPDDNKCAKPGAAGGGEGGNPGMRGVSKPFDPHSTFGHVHPGPAEWWIVQAGHIDGKFENMGDYKAEEGDVLYAAPMGWHQMGVEGPGPSVRTAVGGYELINMFNTADLDKAGQ
ncbi:MAG TPA: cupin domain-containing protein [Caulobacteraceae bacterium]|nr:cupin domain-containing protein [Caulobacteraceae bacterium]